MGDDNMLSNITFKTDLGEIITVESIAILFDSITKKHEAELVSLSLFPQYNKLRNDIIEKTISQRNAELSKLLSEIASRKQEIKINIWQTLSKIGNNKKKLQKGSDASLVLEQLLYEEEQIIKVYENGIRMLENKEKKIMTGKYSRFEKVNKISRKRTLKTQLEELKSEILSISKLHDNYLSELEEKFNNLIEKAIISTKTAFPKSSAKTRKNETGLVLEGEIVKNVINEANVNEKNLKDFYLYEPNAETLEDELIYELLMPREYEDKEGLINAVSLTTENLEYEVA